MKTITFGIAIIGLMLLDMSLMANDRNSGMNLQEAVDLFSKNSRHGRKQFGKDNNDDDPVGYFGNGYERNFDRPNRYDWRRVALEGPAIADGYGMGGYSDPNRVDFPLKWCTERSTDPRSCTAEDPDGGRWEWRFVSGMGWRKFEHYGAARKDWWDFKNTILWLRNGYGYGYPNFGYDPRYTRLYP